MKLLEWHLYPIFQRTRCHFGQCKLFGAVLYLYIYVTWWRKVQSLLTMCILSFFISATIMLHFESQYSCDMDQGCWHWRSLLYRLDKCRVDGSYPWKSSIIDTTLSKLQSLIPLFHWQTRMSTDFTCTVTPCGVCPNTGEHPAAGICTYEIPIRTPIYDYKITLLQKGLNDKH